MSSVHACAHLETCQQCRGVYEFDVNIPLADLRELLREIRELPSEYDLATNAVARAMWEIARRAS